MAFFVDANIVVYAGSDGPQHPSCREVLLAITEERADGRTSTAVLEEIWHIELSRKAGDVTGLTRSTYALFTPLLPITDETVERALSLDGGRLGANDRIHVATCALNGIDTIVSADADFDGIGGLRRVDPLDRRAVTRLLNG
ncbi:MAG: type II toxin-antitoxin system VapC family toxin [Actinobacteria bacterium]|nr:type II toxin-antitoxin system VapC family toxin [Actinomycetota bacterium]